jgi:thiol-disulfide isomerase/thioredoxin
MSAFIRFINSKLKPYSTIIIAIFMILVIILVGLYMYKNNKLYSTKNDFKDVANENGDASNMMMVYYFYVDWCPHCVKAKPEWSAFDREYNGKVINGCLVQSDGYNCTDDALHADLTKRYNIESFPTVLIVKNNVRYDFDAKVTTSALKNFVEFVSKQ